MKNQAFCIVGSGFLLACGPGTSDDPVTTGDDVAGSTVEVVLVMVDDATD